MRFSEPGWLIVLGLAPLPWLFARSRPRIAWPTLDGVGKTGRRWPVFKANIPYLLRGLAIAAIAVALARPQSVGGRTRIDGEGVAIVVALDQSSSMNAVDFPDGPEAASISRLEAARRTLARFVEGRPDDLLGLVVFANYPDTACPPTLDHSFLLDTLRSVRSARPGDDGTNLGDAMVLAVEALRESTPKKKVLILLTDGRNSPAVPRPTDPEKAARIARKLEITVHTIAVGRAGGLVRGVEPTTNLKLTAEVDGPDLVLLEILAKAGGGRAFVAADARALDEVFATIDSLEKSPIRGEVRTRYREHYGSWAASALGLLLMDRLLSTRRVRRLP